MSDSPIADFFSGKSVLVTGATGFVGKVLVEKLLRCCPDIAGIYLLMRPKRGQQVKARLEEMLDAKLFDGLRKSGEEPFKKLVPVMGDMTLAGLGLSDEERLALTENVSVVFHSAATVRFDEPLKYAVAMNLIGTKRILDLCHTMPKLEAFIHVSTAYCYSDRRIVTEQVYPPPADPENIMKVVDILDEPIIDQIETELIKNTPNTYVFTKALAETLVVNQGGRLPIAIVRPSIVTATWKEPFPGWVDSLNGPTGLMAGAGKGVLRSFHCIKESIADFIPVDIVANHIITVAWHTATTRPNSLVVYNCTSGASNPVYWKDVERYIKISILRNPFNEILWYPGGSFKNSKLLNQLCFIFFHNIPAYIFDMFARITGRKPILVNIQKKLQKAMNCIEFFTTNEFGFTNDNMMHLLTKLQKADKKIFNFDITNMSWASYHDAYILGIRKYIMKEDPTTLPAARANLRKMHAIHWLTQALIAAGAWKLIILRSEKLRKTWYYMFIFLVHIIKSLSRMIPSPIS